VSRRRADLAPEIGIPGNAFKWRLFDAMDAAQDAGKVADLEVDAIPEEIAEGYVDIRALPDGRLIGVFKLFFHWTMHVNIDWSGYEDRYCFATYELAKTAFDEWNGKGDPAGWHKHVGTGRRRNLVTGEEWIEP
jgi:hypothetical protein